jgi:hypothetical protein
MHPVQGGSVCVPVCVYRLFTFSRPVNRSIGPTTELTWFCCRYETLSWCKFGATWGEKGVVFGGMLELHWKVI